MKLYFNPFDIFKGPRVALSFQRIWIQFIGLVIGYFFYIMFTYTALRLDGLSLAQSWLIYRIFPFFPLNSSCWIGWLVFGVGLSLVLYTQLLTATAVSRSTYMLLKGQNFYTWREAWRFALRKKWSVLFAPAALLFLIACFYLAGWILGLIGLIPAAGIVIFSLIFIFFILCAMILLFLMILFAGTILLVPAILATTDEDAFETIFQTIALVWHQPWRLLGSQFFNWGISFVALTIFGFFTKRAILLMMSIYQFPLTVAKSFRTDFLNTMNQAFAILQQWLLNLSLLLDKLMGESGAVFRSAVFLNDYFPLLKKSLVGPEVHLAAIIVAISLLITGGIVFAYAFATFNSANVIIYITLRYRRSKENLLERTDYEEKIDDDENEINPE